MHCGMFYGSKRKSKCFLNVSPLSIVALDRSLKFHISTLVDWVEIFTKLVLKRVPSGKRQSNEQGGWAVKKF